ncbi:hypothetical protein JZU54_05120, partial [bacterium]|nr:hypothetical protein [bacterium]
PKRSEFRLAVVLSTSGLVPWTTPGPSSGESRRRGVGRRRERLHHRLVRRCRAERGRLNWRRAEARDRSSEGWHAPRRL